MSVDELHFVYISQVVPGRDHTAFADICRTARSRNPERGIAGVLLFDGQRFLQWVHGRRADIQQLMGSIALDARHTALSVHLEAMLPALDPQPTWRTGFVDADALDAFAGLQRADAVAVFEGLQRLIEQADLEPPLPVNTRRAAPGPDAS